MKVSTFYYKSLDGNNIAPKIAEEVTKYIGRDATMYDRRLGYITFNEEGKPCVRLAWDGFEKKNKLLGHLKDKANYEEVLFFLVETEWSDNTYDEVPVPIIGCHDPTHYNRNYLMIPSSQMLPFNSASLWECHDTFGIKTKFLSSDDGCLFKSNVVANDFIHANEGLTKRLLTDGRVEFNIIELSRKTKSATKIHFASSGDNMIFPKDSDSFGVISCENANIYDGGFLGRIVTFDRREEQCYFNKVSLTPTKPKSDKMPYDLSFIKDYENPKDKRFYEEKTKKSPKTSTLLEEFNNERESKNKTKSWGFEGTRHRDYWREEPVDDVIESEEVFPIITTK